jgi:molybdenum cofactor guanylyltransferase
LLFALSSLPCVLRLIARKNMTDFREAEIRRGQITGVILAGGRAQRMGGRDKGLIELCGRPMAEHVLTALRPQVGCVIINANRNREQYAALGCPVVADSIGEYFGPLAGTASALQAADTDYVLTVPCDSPLVPEDLALRLAQALAREGAEIVVAHDGERMQPVFALVSRSLLPSLLAYLEAGERKIDLWFARHRLALADFSDRPETFLNVNTPEERAALEDRLCGGRAPAA